MRYIDSWLTGLGLDYIIPKLKANGITTPKKLAQLSLLDMYEVVGVEDSEDRKKLYFLIQRLQTILSNKSDQSGAGGLNNDEDDDPAPPPELPSPTQKKNLRAPPPPPTTTINEDLMKSTGTEKSSEDDLRVLRKNRRTTMDTSMLGSLSQRGGDSGKGNTEGISGGAVAAKAEAASRIARRSSHIPQIERSTSAELNNAGSDFRGPVAVPTNAFARKLTLNTSGKETGSGSSQNSPLGDGGATGAASNRRVESKIRAPAKPSASDAKTAADKQALLLQKQKQLAAEEEALRKLQRSNSMGKVNKSIRTTAPSPPASPPRVPPPPLALPSKSYGIAGLPVKATSAAGGSNNVREERTRSPPPPYDWQEPEKPTSARGAVPVPAAAPPATAAASKPRPSYPPARASPSTVDSEPEYTDTDSYDYYDPTRQPQADGGGIGEFEDEEYDEDDGRSDEIVDMAIRVVVRKRPISKRELANGDRDVMEVSRRGRVQVHEPKTKVDLTKIIETQEFRFDDAFEAHETNEVIYGRTIKNLVSFVFDGGKASCFAYGQTGSGKTFTMMGCRPEAPAEAVVNAGLYVLAARDIFAMAKEPQYKRLRVFVSCFEIYGGKLFDLLNQRGVVKCLEDAKQQVQLPGLTEHQVRDVNDLLDLMAQGHTQRSTGSTGANAESSRSHMVMQILLREPEPTAPAHQRVRGRPNISIVAPPASGNQGAVGGKLSFIDLAGSERGADTTHNSKQTRMEGAEINTSLLALKEVIRSLERKHGHTPFRGSKLTQVLKDSFVGEKTRTCMVACVSPSHSNCEHTLNTLRYADRVKEHQSSSSGNGSAGPHHVGSSNYDSMAYDAGSARPQTANSAMSGGNPGVAAGGGVTAKSRPNTASSRPATASPPAAADNSRVRRGTDSSNNSDVSFSSRPPSSGNVVGGMKPPSRIATAGSSIPSGRSASVSTASSRREKENANLQQVPPSPIRAVTKEALQRKASAPNARQGSVPRGAVLSPGGVASQQGPPASPSAKKMLRHQSSPVLPSDRRTSMGSQRTSAPVAPPQQSGSNSRRSSTGDSGRRTAAAAAADDSFNYDNPMKGGRGSVGSAGGGSRNSSRLSAGAGDSDVEEVSFTRSDGGGDEEERNGDPFDSTELIQKTVGLLSAHKSAIAEMVEVMKEEMELVQAMENIDERDSDRYIERLARLLSTKSDAISSLRGELNSFQKYRSAMY